MKPRHRPTAGDGQTPTVIIRHVAAGCHQATAAASIAATHAELQRTETGKNNV